MAFDVKATMPGRRPGARSVFERAKFLRTSGA